MTTIALRPPAGHRPDSRGPAFGLGISLLVHAAVIAWLMQAKAPQPVAQLADTAPAKRITVWLRPPAPAPVPAPVPIPVPEPAAPARPAAAVHPAAPAHPTARRHPPAQAAAPAPEAPTTAPAPEAPAVIDSLNPSAVQAPPASDGAPAADIGAARQAARAFARGEGKSLVALPERRPVVDPNSGKPPGVDPIEASRRKDCKTAYAGMGLLAVIPLAIDAVRSATKDSGCKW